MTVELERKFYKWYKRINISCDEQKTTNRWDGIQNAVGLFENLVDISGLLKIYYRLSFDVSEIISSTSFKSIFFIVSKLLSSDFLISLDISESTLLAISDNSFKGAS